MAKKKFLLLFLLCSLLPLAFAQAFLSLGWFGGATTNKGQWLSEEIVLLPKAAGDVHWRLVYVMLGLGGLGYLLTLLKLRGKP